MARIPTLAKTAVFSVIVPGTVVVGIPRLLARYDREARVLASAPARAIGFAALVAGSSLYLHTAWRFTAEGRGTPSPSHETEELVTGGIYAVVRNPMYVGVLLVLVGQAVRYRSLHVCWWTIVCWLGFHRRVVEDEEPHLEDRFGAEYEAYREAVPRWIPRPR